MNSGNKTHQKSVLLFLTLTFALNWSMAGVFYLLNLPYKGLIGMSLGMVYMLVPMSAALILQLIFNKEPVSDLHIRFRYNHWFLPALFLLPVISLLSIVSSVMLPGIEYSPDMEYLIDRFRETQTQERINEIIEANRNYPVHPLFIGFFQAIIAGATVNAVFAFGEELGWRGYLHNHLIHLGFWRTSFLTGMIWGIWHAPLILMGHNYPDHPQTGVFMMTVWCILLAPLFTLLRIKSHSVIPAAIAHGTLNGSAGLSYMMLKGGSDLTVGITGVAGFIVLIILNAGIYFYLKNKPDNETNTEQI